jgi:hypothetical protein
MKAIKVFWAYVVLSVGGILFAALALTAIRGCCANPTIADLVVGLGPEPHTARLLQRLGLALAIAAFPAGVAAARHLGGSLRAWGRFGTGTLLPLALLCFVLVGYGIPAAARADHAGSPYARFGWPTYYYFHELPGAARAFQVRADSVAARANPKVWAMDRDLARLVTFRHLRDPNAVAAVALDSYAGFTLAIGLLACLIALVGMLVSRWSATTSAPMRRLQNWAAALLLVVAFRTVLGSFSPYIGTMLRDPWQQLADHGFGLLVIPLPILLPLAWTSFLAWRRPTPAAPSGAESELPEETALA